MEMCCPHCGVKGSVDESFKGRKVRCPKCTDIFEVGLDVTAEVVEESAFVSIPSSVVSEEDVVQDHDEIPVVDTVHEEYLQGQATDAVPSDKDKKLEGSPLEKEEVSSMPEGAAIISERDIIEPIDKDYDTAELITKEKVERESDSVDSHKCWQCGKKDDAGQPFINRDGRLYCSDCNPVEETYGAGEDKRDKDTPSRAYVRERQAKDTSSLDATVGDHQRRFLVGEMIRESWQQTEGAKGVIWMAHIAIVVLVLIVDVVYFRYGQPTFTKIIGGVYSGSVSTPFSIITGVVMNIISIILGAGIFFIGIRKVAGDRISWTMVFKGFSCVGKLIVVSLLQFILVSIGFALLILPGIYLSVGYSMAIPLVVDRNMSPWQALKTSRKATHRVWWRMFGVFAAMAGIVSLSLIPFGIGLIWTLPMGVVLLGVVYRRLFSFSAESGKTTVHI